MTKIMETTSVKALIVNPILVKTRPNDSAMVMLPPPLPREWPNRPHTAVTLFYHKTNVCSIISKNIFRITQKKPSIKDGFLVFSLLFSLVVAIQIQQNHAQ